MLVLALSARPGGRTGARPIGLTSYDGTARLWDIRPASWKRHACVVAGRPLTHAEWASALPDRAYAPACEPANR